MSAANSSSDGEVMDIYNAVQSRALASLVDHRFILAVILQEVSGRDTIFKAS